MVDNDVRSDLSIVVGFVAVLLVSVGVIVAAVGGIVGQPQQFGLTGDESLDAGVAAAPNETATATDSSATPTTSTDDSSPPTTTDARPPPTTDDTRPSTTGDTQPTDEPEATGASSSVGSEGSSGAGTGTAAPTETRTETDAGTSDDSSGTDGSSEGTNDPAGNSDGSDESEESADGDGDADPATETDSTTQTETDSTTQTETAELTPTETPESDRPDGDLGLFVCDDASNGTASCQIRLTEEPDSGEPSWDYDMPVTDDYAHWLLSHTGVFGIQFEPDDDGQSRMLVSYGDGVAPDLPRYTANGIATSKLLTDAMPGHGPPPEGYEWEPLPNRSYEYGLEISDSAARTVLAHDDVVGVKAGLHGGVVFYVTSEEFAEEAPEAIEGRTIEYSVVEPVSPPDQ